MSVAEGNPETWAVGFLDECWWSRLALPTSSSFSEEGKPLRLSQETEGGDSYEQRVTPLELFFDLVFVFALPR